MNLLGSTIVNLECDEKSLLAQEDQREQTFESIAKHKAVVIAAMRAAGLSCGYFGDRVYMIDRSGVLRCYPARYLGDLPLAEPYAAAQAQAAEADAKAALDAVLTGEFPHPDDEGEDTAPPPLWRPDEAARLVS